MGGDCFYKQSIADLAILLGTTLSSRVYVSTFNSETGNREKLPNF